MDHWARTVGSGRMGAENTAASLSHCASMLLTAVHLPLIALIWAVDGAPPALAAAALGVGAAGLAIGWYGRGRAASLMPHAALAGLVAAVVVLTWSLAIVAYLAVLVVLFALARAVDDRAGSGEDTVAQIEQIAQTKDQLLALVQHEFRTPLTGVVGFARTLSSRIGSLDEDAVRQFADAIAHHSNRLGRLVDNLLDSTREFDPASDAECDLQEVIEGLLTGMDPARVSCRARSPLPARIDQDPARRIVLNLLDNAVKFADPDTVVEVDAWAEGDVAVIEVANAGPPIPAALRKRIYEPFVLGDASDTRRAEGLGLGLHVVRRLAEAYGGQVDALSAPGSVIFRVRLPRQTCLPAVGAPRSSWARS